MIARRVLRLLSSAPRERALLLEAMVLLGGISPLLRFGPAGLAGRALKRTSRPVTGLANERLVAEVAAAVERVAPHVPGETCLARALTGWLMVTRRHEPATVRLGVARDTAVDRFEAHAWLECNGRRVIGGERADEYILFPSPP